MAAVNQVEFQVPEVGQAVQVRNRLATVRAVDAYESTAVNYLISTPSLLGKCVTGYLK